MLKGLAFTDPTDFLGQHRPVSDIAKIYVVTARDVAAAPPDFALEFHQAERVSTSTLASLACAPPSTIQPSPIPTPEVMPGVNGERVDVMVHSRPSHWMQEVEKKMRRSKWKEVLGKSRGEIINSRRIEGIEKRWADEKRALSTKWGLQLNRRGNRQAVRAIKKEIHAGRLPSA